MSQHMFLLMIFVFGLFCAGAGLLPDNLGVETDED